MGAVIGNWLNYTGGKSKQVPVIEDHLPEGYEDMVACDLFAGSGMMSLSFDFKKVLLNDSLPQLVSIHENFIRNAKITGADKFLTHLKHLSEDLRINGKDKEEAFTSLKESYNRSVVLDKAMPADILYMLVCCGNSNYMRFNSAGEYNIPYGKRYFNPSMQKSLLYYLERVAKLDVEVTCNPYKEVSLEGVDMLMLDPPYFNSGKAGTTYNKEWGIHEEYGLYQKVENFAKKGGKFLMTNTLFCKGSENYILKEFLESGDYTVVDLKNDFKNCNYQRKNDKTIEILVKNY